MSWRSTMFEAVTWSTPVERHDELFWIVYLVLVWTVPDLVLVVDPYALSVVPLIAVIEIGFRFYEVVVESFAWMLSEGVRQLSLYTLWAVFLLPFVALGLYVIWLGGSGFTTAMYFVLVGRTVLASLQSERDEAASMRVIGRIVEGALAGFVFLWCMLFAFVPWPELGLAGYPLEVSGEGLLVEHPHRGVPTGIVAFAVLWAVKHTVGDRVKAFVAW